MSRGQTISGTVVTVDLEFLDAIHALQVSKALQRHLGCARHKLQEVGSLRLVE